MKLIQIERLLWRFLTAAVVFGGLLLSPLRATPKDSSVVPPDTGYFGKTYSEWSAAWWTWALGLSGSTVVVSGSTALIVTHPFIDSPNFDITQGQTGQVWFLAPVTTGARTVVRQVTIPADTALLVGIFPGEWSDLEGIAQSKTGFNYDDRMNLAHKQATSIDPKRLSLQVDGQDIGSLADFVVVSPEFTFAAPTPWVFGGSNGSWGGTGATGTAVADGYFVLVKPLSRSKIHSIRFTGGIKGASSLVDMIYNIRVE